MFIKPPLSTYLFRCAIWRKTCLFFCTVCHQLNRSIFFFFTMWDIFKREQMSSKRRKTCLEAKKFSNSRRYTPVWPTVTFWQIEATFFSNQMIFAAGALSFRRPCHRKKKKKTGLKTKTGRWGGSQTDILGLTSAPRGTIRSTSAIQSAAWPTNRLFSHSHYGIIGVVVAGHQQYVYRSGLQQFNRAHRNWKPALKHGTCTSC